MGELEPLAAATRSAVAELEFAARSAGVIGANERIEYIPGSRTNGQPPQVDVRSPEGSRPLDLMPEFFHTTRAREVVVAMDTAAAMLRKLVGQGILPADS